MANQISDKGHPCYVLLISVNASLREPLTFIWAIGWAYRDAIQWNILGSVTKNFKVVKKYPQCTLSNAFSASAESNRVGRGLPLATEMIDRVHKELSLALHIGSDDRILSDLVLFSIAPGVNAIVFFFCVSNDLPELFI